MPKSVVCGGSRYLRLDVLGRRLDARLELPWPAASTPAASPGLGGVDQPLVVLHRELGVDGQPHDVARPARSRPGSVWRTRPARRCPACATLASYWLGRQHLLEQRAQLHLAPGAARLHVGQHLLEVADAGRQRLHLAQALVHLLEPLAHLLERLAEALLERALEPLVHGLAHLLELGRVVLLQLAQAVVDRRAQVAQTFLVRVGQGDELRREGVQVDLLVRAELADAGDQ